MAAVMQSGTPAGATPADAGGAPHEYQGGFGNQFASEALPGALPRGRNSPQRCAYGLYAEQISGTAFTAPRSHNRRSWMYRLRPGAVHEPFEPLAHPGIVSEFSRALTPPWRWSAAGTPTCRSGCPTSDRPWSPGAVRR